LKTLRGEIAGGIAGGVVTIPASIGYGVLAFGALGDAYVAPAVLAGLYGAVAVSLVVLALGQWLPVNFAPRSIRQVDTDRSVYIVASGSTTVRVSAAGSARQVRLATYARGTIFGEMALLDRQPRSATVTADNEVVCYVLSEPAFATLIAERPVIAVRLLANVARELSVRLRNATRMISELER